MKKMREMSISLSKVKLAFSNRFYDMNFVKKSPLLQLLF